MQPEGSLPCSQQPATGSYPEPDGSIHNFSPHFPNIHSNVIFPSAPRCSECSTTFRFPDQNFYAFLIFLSCMLHARPSHRPSKATSRCRRWRNWETNWSENPDILLKNEFSASRILTFHEALTEGHQLKVNGDKSTRWSVFVVVRVAEVLPHKDQVLLILQNNCRLSYRLHCRSAVGLHPASFRFEFRQGYRLSWIRCLWLSSVFSGKWRDIILKSAILLTFLSFMTIFPSHLMS